MIWGYFVTNLIFFSFLVKFGGSLQRNSWWFLSWQMALSSVWQLFHPLHPYMWFEAILSTIKSSFLFWQGLEDSYKEINDNFHPSRWLEVLLDKFVIHSNPTCDLRPFCQQSNNPFFSGKVKRILKKKFMIIFVQADGLIFCLTTLSFTAT